MPADLVAHSERRFRAMGSDAHVIVVGAPGPRSVDPAQMALGAERRITELEHLWSRFDAKSEITALTRHAGSPVAVSAETRELVERAIAAWRLTGGLFDPTVLGALVRAGYDRSFDEIEPMRSGDTSASPEAVRTESRVDDIEVIANTVRLPAGTGFDPGGIGKGLAADIIVGEVLGAGASGVCVNLGGDVRVDGTAPGGGAWTVAVDHPEQQRSIARFGLARGAVATSTTLRRRWLVDGESRHHLIDPATGRSSDSDLTFASVVTGHAWAAEVFAKAILLHGTPLPFDLLKGTGAAALAIDRDGHVLTSPGIDAYLDEPIPARLIPSLDYAKASAA
jgi:thiamine biosynthesis lipoprotein